MFSFHAKGAMDTQWTQWVLNYAVYRVERFYYTITNLPRQRLDFLIRPGATDAEGDKAANDLLGFWQIKACIILWCAKYLNRQLTCSAHLLDMVPLIDEVIHVGVPVIEAGDTCAVHFIYYTLSRIGVRQQHVKESCTVPIGVGK